MPAQRSFLASRDVAAPGAEPSSGAGPAPVVSVVLPCYRAAALARRSVEQLRIFLSGWFGDAWEVVVVDDGGGDFGTDEWCGDPNIRLIGFRRNRGKGAAVQAGMTVARAPYRIFTDVDLPYGTEPLPAMVHYLASGHFHLVIGDRHLPESSYLEDQGLMRRSVSWISATLIGTLVTGGFFDTQCGIKAVRGDVADLVFPLLRIAGFTFDVELLYVALRHRLDIKRIPVTLENNDTSSVRVVRDSIRGVRDLAWLGFRKGRGAYDLPALMELRAREFAAVAQANAADAAALVARPR